MIQDPWGDLGSMCLQRSSWWFWPQSQDWRALKGGFQKLPLGDFNNTSRNTVIVNVQRSPNWLILKGMFEASWHLLPISLRYTYHIYICIVIIVSADFWTCCFYVYIYNCMNSNITYTFSSPQPTRRQEPSTEQLHFFKCSKRLWWLPPRDNPGWWWSVGDWWLLKL